MYKKWVKRGVDVIIASLLVIIVLPIVFIALVILYFSSGDGVFFTQERPGKNEKVFKLYKFKTMNDKRDASGNLLPDEERLTKAGKWIRKLSLDELPQLINVLKGDMSLIGPRPWLVEYLPLYNEYQKRRHEVKPGITGWAQVNGRNMLSWKDRFDYDIYYVENLSFLLDLKIVFLTLWKVVRAKDINGKKSASMTKFRGN